MSLDVLRGFDMMFIMGLTTVVTQLFSALGCDVSGLERQFHHAPWHGLSFYDTIFPLFLFLTGVSWPFSLSKRRAQGHSNSAIVGKIVRRGLTLVFFGFVCNGLFNLDFANMTWGAVLVRIGIAWAFAAALSVFVGTRGRIALAVGILLAHWAVCVFVVAPDAQGLDPLSMEGCFAGWLDRTLLPGKLTHPGVISNQGILSTFPATVTAMLGVFAGEFLLRDDLPGNCKTAGLTVGAALLAVLGVLMSVGFGRWSMPLNKTLWSSSFTLVVGGYSALLLAIFYWLIDVKGWWRRTLFFRVIGMNSITIYMANRIMGFGVFAAFFFGGFAHLLPPEWGRVVLSAATFGFGWLFLLFLYSRKIFLRV